jgi:chromosome segregation ATPase
MRKSRENQGKSTAEEDPRTSSEEGLEPLVASDVNMLDEIITTLRTRSNQMNKLQDKTNKSGVTFRKKLTQFERQNVEAFSKLRMIEPQLARNEEELEKIQKENKKLERKNRALVETQRVYEIDMAEKEQDLRQKEQLLKRTEVGLIASVNIIYSLY